MIRRRLITGTLSNCVGKLTAVGTWLFLTPFLLSELGPSAYALWVLVGAFASYALLLDHGFGGAVVKYVAEHVARGEREAARELVASATWLFIGLAFVAVAASALLAPVLPPLLGVEPGRQQTASWLIVLTGINIGAVVAFTPAASVLRGLQRYDLVNAASVINTLAEAAGVVIALVAGYGLLGMMCAFVITTMMYGIGNVLLVARVAPDLRIGLRGASMAAVRRMGTFSASLFTIEVAGKMQQRTDEFVIAAFGALSGVTPYALARKLGELSEIVPIQFLKVVMPLASELEAGNDRQKLRQLYIVASRVALGIAAAATVVLIVAGSSVLSVWVGQEYAQYGHLVTLLAVSTLVATSQWPAVEMLKGMARHRVVAITSFAAGVANVALSIVLLPVWGLVGVALGTLIPTTLASLCVVMPFAMRTLGVSARTAVTEIWVPALAPAFVAGALASALHASAITTTIGLFVWMAVTLCGYAALYLAMPPSRAERRLVCDAARSAVRASLSMIRGLQPWWGRTLPMKSTSGPDAGVRGVRASP